MGIFIGYPFEKETFLHCIIRIQMDEHCTFEKVIQILLENIWFLSFDRKAVNQKENRIDYITSIWQNIL